MAEQRYSIEDLIALRDGLQTTGNLRRLVASDIDAIKHLAEVRLFALLLSVAQPESDGPPSRLPEPETLVRYLTNTLPIAEVQAVESAIRGNAEGLEFLLALKDALFRPDVWQREPSPTPPLPSPRIELGRVRLTVLGGAVRFWQGPEMSLTGLRSAAAVEFEDLKADLEPAESGLLVNEFAAPQISPQDQLLDAVDDIERRIDQLRRTLGALSEELSRGIKARRPPAKAMRPPADAVRATARALRRELLAIESQLPQLESLAGKLDAEAAAAAIRREIERAREEAERRAAAAREAERLARRLAWPTTLTLTHPGIEIELRSVDTTPTPALGIIVRPMQGAPYAPPEATLVEPNQRFTALTAGPDGLFVAPPPTRPMLLLIDTDRTYSIQLEPA